MPRRQSSWSTWRAPPPSVVRRRQPERLSAPGGRWCSFSLTTYFAFIAALAASLRSFSSTTSRYAT